jgi:hypothetical protein
MTSGNQAPSESRRELWGEVDHVTLVILGGRDIQRGQHGHGARPHRGISNIST